MHHREINTLKFWKKNTYYNYTKKIERPGKYTNCSSNLFIKCVKLWNGSKNICHPSLFRALLKFDGTIFLTQNIPSLFEFF